MIPKGRAIGPKCDGEKKHRGEDGSEQPKMSLCSALRSSHCPQLVGRPIHFLARFPSAAPYSKGKRREDDSNPENWRDHRRCYRPLGR